MRVLVVDDSRTQAEEMQLALVEAGFDVVIALDGAQALAALRRGGVDVVVSDVVMPTLDGYGLCRAIQADASLAGVPIVLRTALSDPFEILHAVECGADAFVNKRDGAAHAIARVRDLLENRALREREGTANGLPVLFHGRRYVIPADRHQILDLLLTTFQDVIATNRALEESQRELAVKHEALLRAQRQREELSALLVHDLKSPAAGIAMTASLRLRGATLSPDDRRYWGGVLNAAESITRMVMNLLDIARSEDGTLTLRVEDCVAADLVSDAIASFGDDRRARIDVAIAPEMPSLRGDTELLRRVLQNLLDNALRYGPSGGRVALSAAVRDGQVEFRVADQGRGVPPALRDRVFEKYQRGERDDVRGGKGLGLAFCRLAVTAHGGTIHVEDNVPHGACFVVRLPLAEAA